MDDKPVESEPQIPEEEVFTPEQWIGYQNMSQHTDPSMAELSLKKLNTDEAFYRGQSVQAQINHNLAVKAKVESSAQASKIFSFIAGLGSGIGIGGYILGNELFFASGSSLAASGFILRGLIYRETLKAVTEQPKEVIVNKRRSEKLQALIKELIARNSPGQPGQA